MEPITETILCMCSTLSLTSNKSSLAFIFSPSDRNHSVAIQLVEAGQVQPQIFGLQKIWRAAVAEDELSDGSPFRLPLVRKDSILSTWEIVPAALLETTVSLRNEREDALHSSGLSPLDKKT